ncbi:MAG: magnesium transporter, partial [Pygmaiobacter sp.]
MDLIYDHSALILLLETRNFRELRRELAEMNEVDIALFIETLEPENMVLCFRTLPKQMASDVFSEFETETQQIIIESINDQELSVIVEDLFVDDAVDMLEELPASVVKRVLKNATPATRSLIN